MSSDAQVQEMVEESVAHAFDDLKARQWIEAKLRAEENLAATRKALADCAAEMEADDKAKVEAAVESRGRASGVGTRRSGRPQIRPGRAGRSDQAAGRFAHGKDARRDAAAEGVD